MPSILISGAGIGGPVLAWWLARAGWTCTIVERDATPRLTGQQIDIRGAGTTIVEQMGMLDAIKAACVQEKGWGFVDDSGRRRAGFAVGEGTADGFTAEIEILRGELASVLMKSVENNPNVRIVYGDKIVGLEDKANGVDVTFQNGTAWGGIKTQSFDVVVAADGMHSTTRRLMFPELGKMPLHSLGQYMVYFSIPLDPAQDSDMWASWSNAPGGRLAFIRPDMARNRVSAYLGICNNPDGNRLFANYYKLSMEEQKEAWRTLFADTVKENRIAARIFKSMDSPEANDYFMHEIAQVRIPSWTRGHMALLGDAAACPSPISGMGTTVAIVGAYFLALELVKNPNDHVAALRAYEDAMRPVVNKAQKLIPGAPAIMNPQTRWGIWIFYTIIRFISWTNIQKWFEGSAVASKTPVPAWPGKNVSVA